MKQSNGCSTSVPSSSAAKQWFEQLAQEKKNLEMFALDVQNTTTIFAQPMS